MGLREKQKKQRHAAILNATARMIREEGFQKTRMDRIASEAGVGVATVYKYFGTKENIIREIFIPDLEECLDRAEQVVNFPPDDPVEAAMALLRCYMALGNHWSDKNILRLFGILDPGASKPSITGVIEYANATVIAQFQRLLEKLIDRGDIPDRIDATKMSEIIFSVFDHEFSHCVLDDELEPAESFEKIEGLVRSLFDSWAQTYR